MGDFFRGWRRKIGLAVLVTALLLTVAWMRSFLVHDTLLLHCEPRWYSEILSRHGRLRWSRSEQPPDSSATYSFDGPSRWHSVDARNDRWFDPATEDQRYQWQWKWYGFGIGAILPGSAAPSIRLWVVPYWLFILPLTLLSAWLLLIKQSKSRVVAASEPNDSPLCPSGIS